MAGWQHKPSRVRRRVRIVDLKQASRRLLLEPFPGVALVGLGASGQFGRAQRVACASAS